jgi:hypothetical protein
VKTGKGKDKIAQQYIIGQSQFENVNEFTYLGVQINSQNKISDEIRKRMQAGNRCYYANKKLCSDKILNCNSKIQIYKTIIRPTVTSGSETWVLTASDENQLKIFERKILRKIYGPIQNPDGSWRIKTNEELSHKMKHKDILKFIKSQRLKWAAHVMSMEKTRNTRKIPEWTTYKTRPVGRPRLR